MNFNRSEALFPIQIVKAARRYAGIGSRATPESALRLMEKLGRLAKALEQVQWTAARNREAFLKLDELGAAISVSNVTGEGGKPIRGQYALLLDNVDDAVTRELKEGKRGIIFFSVPHR